MTGKLMNRMSAEITRDAADYVVKNGMAVTRNCPDLNLAVLCILLSTV